MKSHDDKWAGRVSLALAIAIIIFIMSIGATWPKKVWTMDVNGNDLYVTMKPGTFFCTYEKCRWP